MGQVKLIIDRVSKSFTNNKNRLLVLDQVDLEVMTGEILCILGPSGCGKSTLLRLIAGLDRPDTGAIFLDRTLIERPGPERVLIFQDFQQLFPWQTVLDNVLFPLQVNGIGNSVPEREAIARYYLSLVKLEGFDRYYPGQLSGGMKQKTAIARGLALRPQVLLMDEPFASLDALTRNSLQQTLLEVWQNTGVTIIFVTHDIQEAFLISDRIIVMDQVGHNLKAVIVNPLPRPRSLRGSQFAVLWDQIYSLLEA